MSDSAFHDLSGKELGNYRLERPLGAGATATVYLARHKSVGRPAALKVFHPHLSSSPGHLERFRREAEAVALLDHPNVVKVYDYAAEQGVAYIALEFVDGETLKAAFDRWTGFPPELAGALIFEVARAVEAAHALNLVHRDIKPENILITREGRVKLTDFGIAQFLNLEHLTLTGALMGTPNFMSPEQVEGGAVGASSDIFSLGILFYYLLTRKLPFDGPSQAQVFRKISASEYWPPDSLNPRVNGMATRMIGRCLQKDPSNRYPSVRALLDDLRELNRSLGLTEPGEEVGHFVRAPEEYSKELPARVRTALLQFIRDRGFHPGGRPKALSAVNHLLALNPGDREAARLLRRLTRGKRAGKIAAWAGVVGIVGLLVVGFRVAGFRGPGQEKKINPVSEPVSIHSPAVPTETVSQNPPFQNLRTRNPRTQNSLTRNPPIRNSEPPPAPVSDSVSSSPTPILKAATQPENGTFKVFTSPWAKLYIDGEYRGNTPFVGDLSVSAGWHRVRLVNPYCQVVNDSIHVDPGAVAEKRYTLVRH